MIVESKSIRESIISGRFVVRAVNKSNTIVDKLSVINFVVAIRMSVMFFIMLGNSSISVSSKSKIIVAMFSALTLVSKVVSMAFMLCKALFTNFGN